MTPFKLPIGSGDPAAAHPDPLLTIAGAAEALGVKVWHVRRAVKRGDIPFYTPFNGRKLVRLSEVLAFVAASRQGGL